MTTSIKLKEAFEVESKHGAFYTNGNVEWHEDSLYCQTPSQISIFDTESGTVTRTVGEEHSEDADTIQTFTTDGRKIVSSHKSGLLKLWNENGELEKMWKYIHKGPIAKLLLKEPRLASGGSDGIIRIWDLIHQACILSLKGCQGVVNMVEMHPEENVLFASGDDGKILSWELQKGELIHEYIGHFSKVTSISFHYDNKYFVSSGRDKVVMLWEVGKSVPLRTVPVYEALETAICLPKKFKLPGLKLNDDTKEASIYAATAGENGVIRVWDMKTSKEMYVQNNSLVPKAKEVGGLSIIKLLFNQKQKTLAVVTAEQNIILHKLKTFECTKQFVGFSDEILDVIFVGENDSHLAVATNSNDIKLYENSTMNCHLLQGHTDLVLALNKSNSNPNLMISSSKDNTIRLWLLEEETARCVGVGRRHTGSVGAVALPFLKANFCVSVSQDTCVKVWDLPEKLGTGKIGKEEGPENLQCSHTQIAHQKDINCVVVSPTDKIIATSSQDKTAKLWTETLTLIGVLKGHKRGVWCVRFSPVDQIVLTSSADCTIKLWSIAELNCLKTFEGHESSVLRVDFISNGMQILSAGGDGLIKMYNVKNSECVTTLEQHDGRVWALAVKRGESSFITGGSDSYLIKWKDVTEDRKLEKRIQQEQELLEEQKLSNYLQNDQLLKALKLALKLDRPLQTLRIIQSVIKKGDTGLADTIKELRNDQKESLLKCVSDWNTNSKNCQPAQLVLNILLGELQTGQFRPTNLSGTIEGTLPYTDRHFKRLTQLMQDLYFISYSVNCMQPHAKGGL